LFVMDSYMDDKSLEVKTAIRAMTMASALCEKVRRELAGGVKQHMGTLVQTEVILSVEHMGTLVQTEVILSGMLGGDVAKFFK